MVRTPETNKAQTTTTQVQLELIFLLLLFQPSGKLCKILSSTWRVRNLGPTTIGTFPFTILGHDPTSNPGITLRQWVHFQGVHNILDLLSWDQEEL